MIQLESHEDFVVKCTEDEDNFTVFISHAAKKLHEQFRDSLRPIPLKKAEIIEKKQDPFGIGVLRTSEKGLCNANSFWETLFAKGLSERLRF